MLAVLPCDLSSIAIFTSDSRHFSDIHISQGSVAKRLRRGGISKREFVVANLLPGSLLKKIEYRLIVGEVMGKSLVSCFFDLRCTWSPKKLYIFQHTRSLEQFKIK